MMLILATISKPLVSVMLFANMATAPVLLRSAKVVPTCAGTIALPDKVPVLKLLVD